MWWGYVIGHTKQCSYFGGLGFAEIGIYSSTIHISFRTCWFSDFWNLIMFLETEFLFQLKFKKCYQRSRFYWNSDEEKVSKCEWGICDVSKCSLISSVSLAWKAAEIRKSNSGAKWNCETPPWRPITGGVKCPASQLDNVMWWTTCFLWPKKRTKDKEWHLISL